MEKFSLVQRKLEAFIRKYYLNRILKGSLLFLALGLCYFLFIVSLEYFLWLSTSFRAVLFWFFVIAELGLLYWFVGIPLFRLLRISKGIDHFQASEIIGRHFPEVNDKLKNLLQLRTEASHSELLLASIEQRSAALSLIPFKDAVTLKRNMKYAKYTLFPVLIIIGLLVAGRASLITNSFERLTDYNTVYLKPAPFRFIIQNDQLSVREGESFLLRVHTVGDYNPELVKIMIDDKDYFMKPISPGVFEYSFPKLKKEQVFQLTSNGITSEEYALKIIEVPKLLNFEMWLDYPKYTGLKDSGISGTGNTSVPEGTSITWQFHTRNAGNIRFASRDSIVTIEIEKDSAIFHQIAATNFSYSFSLSNKNVKEYEKLDYAIQVIRDQYPEISVTMENDSLNSDIQYIKGDISDDYGFSKLQLVYQKQSEPDNNAYLEIPVANAAYDEFYFTFPGNLELEEGMAYTYYFRVFDNDGINGAKMASSSKFEYRVQTEREKENAMLESQKETISRLQENLEEFQESDKELKDISRFEKEKENLNYNERKKLQEFLKRQQLQNEIMKSYAKKLNSDLETGKESKNSSIREKLKERIKNNEIRLEENEKLLEELKRFSEKIAKEELGKKLDELSKKNKSSQRNLEQLLELTKRYYVEEKKQKLARELDEISEEQKVLSESEDENTIEEQEKVNEAFGKFQEEVQDLEEQNRELKKPRELGRKEEDENEIQKDLEQILDDMKVGLEKSVKGQQKDAARKMKEMSAGLQASSMMQASQELEADAESLRQILDNLLTFSFEQEALLEAFNRMDQRNPKYASRLRQQSNLRENFRHIDDSLYMLAMKNPMIDEAITDKLTNIEFDLEKSIERLSENELHLGTSSQQYVITGVNDLANLLDKILSSIQEMMGAPQAGDGNSSKEFQLQDIISKQQELNNQMKEGLEKITQPGNEEKGQGGTGEDQNGELFEIYKEQQKLRLQMEKLMEEQDGTSGDQVPGQMEEVEQQLLEKGMDAKTLERMQNLQYELLKLEKAFKIQGQKDEREANTNLREYKNPVQNQIDRAKEYLNSTEILNRQSLPLRPIYQEKVKDYFGTRRD